MTIDTLLFDLDGTLSDPKPGITGSIQYALSELGRPVPGADELVWCIGPPLLGCFEVMLRDAALAERALAHYRQRYGTVGLYENALYPGIAALLDRLRADDFRLYVATAKPHVYARPILEHFEIDTKFDGLYGPELNGHLNRKADLLAYLIAEERLDPARCLMIGDRHHDIDAARANNIRALAVTYGYGTPEELAAAGPDATVDNLDGLERAIHQLSGASATT